MNFLKAVETAEKNKNIVGQKYNGGIIDEIIIYPTNPEMCKKFTLQYINSQNAQLSIIPYIETDVEIAVVIDKQRILKENIFESPPTNF